MPANRVQAMKSRFENLNDETRNDLTRQRSNPFPGRNRSFHGNPKIPQHNKESKKSTSESDDEPVPEANRSYLYSRENRALVRQTSDPGKKLHRSHAFRCDRNHKISPKRPDSRKGSSETPTLKIGEKPRLSPDRLKRLNLVIQRQMRKEEFDPKCEVKRLPVSAFRVTPKSPFIPADANKDTDTMCNRDANSDDMKELLENASSVPDSQVPQHILDQYAKVLKPKKKNESDVKEMTDSGVSSETEAQETDCEKGRLKKLRAHFEKTDAVDDTLQDVPEKENKENVSSARNSLDSDVYSSTETIKRKNPNILLTDTLKKALKQPLPRGPPPQKPPRTFAAVAGDSAPNSPEFSPRPERKVDKIKKDPKQQLERLEKALQKHNESKVIIPRQTNNIYKIAESESDDVTESQIAESKKRSQTADRRKEMHYLCTEILDIAQRPLLMNSIPNLNENQSSNCFTSLNCGIASSTSSTSIPYAKLNTSDSSQTLNVCADANDTRSKFSTFFSSKTDKCNQNGFQCHCCKCSDTSSARSSVNEPHLRHSGVQNEPVSENDEHIYDEPFAEAEKALDRTVLDKSVRGSAVKWDSGVNGENSYGVVNSGLRRSSEDLNDSEDLKIYDVPCDPSRSPSPEVVSETRTFESLRRGFENSSTEPTPSKIKNKSLEVPDAKPPPVKTRSLDIPEVRNAEPKAKVKMATPVKNNFRLKVSPSDPELKSASELDTPDLKPQQLMSRSLEIPDLLKHQASFDAPDIAVRAKAFSMEDPVEVRTPGRKFATEGNRRHGRFEKNSPASGGQTVTLQRRCERKHQLDVDRENLNKLMSEIYDTVTAQCDMETVSRFPVDQDCSSGEDSNRLSRSLTEKRKNYVRRVSSRVAYIEPQKYRQRHQTMACGGLEDKYTTFRSWKSFKRVRNRSNASRGAEDIDNSTSFVTSTDSDELDTTDSLDDTAGCLDIDRPLQARDRGLFDLCLLVGFNHITGQAYVKSVFPRDAHVPPHIENLVFPETISQSGRRYDLEPSRTQTYSLVLTNEKGERGFGYCRRVLPEGAGFCLPLAYCLISRFRAPGFYYKVLQELESHHGTSDQVFDSLLQQLFEKDFPGPDESITFAQARTPRKSFDHTSVRSTINLGEIKSKTLEPRRTPKNSLDFHETLDRASELGEVVIKRPIEPRLDEDNLSVLLDSLGVPLVIKVFGTMLLERKVVLISDNLSQLSSCMEALQALMYPLVWQQPLVSIIPSELRRDMLEAPLPILAGLLRLEHGDDISSVQFEEGMLIDLSSKGAKVIFEQGDEATIIPSSCYKTLKTALHMESSKNLIGTEQEVEKARNVLIAEAFLRFFVDILSEFWQHFKVAKRQRQDWEDGPVPDEEIIVFDKEQLIARAPNKQTSYFLEWFTETAVFNHLAQNMGKCYLLKRDGMPVDFSRVEGLVDMPVPNFYEVFDERITRRQLLTGARRRPDHSSRNVKNALNKKVRLLKNKLKDLVN